MSTGMNGRETPKAVARCPICQKPAVKAHRPFCSKRCTDIDLGRWLKGGYVVAGEPGTATLPDAPAEWDEE